MTSKRINYPNNPAFERLFNTLSSQSFVDVIKTLGVSGLPTTIDDKSFTWITDYLDEDSPFECIDQFDTL